MKILMLLPALVALPLVASSAPQPGEGCSSSKAKATTAAWGGHEKGTIVETAIEAGSFKTLAAALTAADLVDALQGEGPFTVFAPTDAAFARLPEGTIETLLKPENRGLLQNILTYHVVAGEVPSAKVVGLDSATALNGQRISVQVDDQGVHVAGVQVVQTDIECSNGIIHVVDAVMMPATEDIVDTAVAAGSFETLAAALRAGGLIEALKSDGPFTVFAPTDEAFAALPAGTVESLLKPENRDQLVSILKYHVVSGRVYSDQLANGMVPTLDGKKLSIRLEGGKAWINESNVVAADIETTNGVIHVVDKVLLPN